MHMWSSLMYRPTNLPSRCKTLLEMMCIVCVAKRFMFAGCSCDVLFLLYAVIVFLIVLQ